MLRVVANVSDRKRMSGLCPRARFRRFGTTLGLPNPQQFQLKIIIGPGSPGCQDVPIKNASLSDLWNPRHVDCPLAYAFFETDIPCLHYFRSH